MGPQQQTHLALDRSAMTVSTPDSTQRITGEYVNVGKERGTFAVASRSFAQQFSQIYFVRLAALAPLLRAQAEAKWSGATSKARIVDLEAGQRASIIGTVYVEMEFKPNILKDLASDLQIVKQPPREKYTGGQCQFFLEDDTARIEIKFKDDSIPANLVTGVSMALLGQEDENGDFHVEDYCFADIEPKRAEPFPTGNDEAYIAFVSGVNYDSTKALPFELLTDILSGNIPAMMDIASKVRRLVMVGDSIGVPPRIDEAGKKKYGVEHARYNHDAMKQFDLALDILCQSLPVDILPGPHDPSTASLPQLPIHRGLLPKASAGPALQPAMNPHLFELDGVSCLAFAGQNVDSVFQFSGFEDRLAIAEAMLRWRNVAPTAPDTLWCYPYYDRDPFVLDACPDIFVIGNQPALQTKLVHRQDGSPIRILLLSKFSQDPAIHLVSLRDLSTKIIKINLPN